MARARLGGALPPVVVLVSVLALGGCAADPVVTRWVQRWHRVEHQYEDGDYALAAVGFDQLRRSAPTPVDSTMVRLREASALDDAGHPAAAFRALDLAARDGVRRMDRARARLGQARVAERRGFVAAAIRIYRRVVATYPNSMPGLRSLHHLERLAEDLGERGVDAHLRWTLGVYDALEQTELGDNLVYYAGLTAYRRFQTSGRPEQARLAADLFELVHLRHYPSGLWDEAMWHLSWLEHRLGRYDEEIRIIRRIQGTRELATFLGSYDTLYYWVGQLRIALVLQNELGRPADAARSYDWFLEEFPSSRWRDDALFWQGCAWLRAGVPGRAEAAFRRIPSAYRESKYLRRLDAARADPASPICDPLPFTEADW